MKAWLPGAWWVLACACACVAACADEAIPPEAVPFSEAGPLPEAPGLDASTTVAKLIGPGGGVISLDDGFVLRIPPRALASDVRVTVTPLDRAGGIGPRYRLGPEGQTFLGTVSVTLPFDPQMAAARGAGLPVHVFTASNPAGSFVSLGGTLVDPTHVRSDITTLAIFGAGIEAR